MSHPQHRKSKPLGVLVLHGFTSSIKTVDGLLPYLKAAKLPYRMPVLRGHGSTPESLMGVTYRDWIDDAEDALVELLGECSQAVVVGLSMGGLVALEMGMRHRQTVAAVVAVAPALKFTNPLAPLSLCLSGFLSYFPSPHAFTDRNCAKASENYSRFPVKAFASLYELSKLIESKLRDFTQPLLILQHRKAQVTHPKGAKLIYANVRSKDKKLHWFNRSGHEMMQDCEREAVFETIMTYVESGKTSKRS